MTKVSTSTGVIGSLNAGGKQKGVQHQIYDTIEFFTDWYVTLRGTSALVRDYETVNVRID